MTYEEARVYLDNVSKYGSVLGLDTIQDLLGVLGNPQDELRFIHIAGTNGKGSVLAYISTILSEAGFTVGRYISPTVISYRERIQVDGKWIEEEELAVLVEKVQKAVACMETNGRGHPTVFEIETAMAFLYFRDRKCDYVVLETGLGGRQDATNVVKTTDLAVFSTISRDHVGILGDTLEEIAREKAGIIKPGCVVVSAAQKEEARAVLEAEAERMRCPIIFAEPECVSMIEEGYRGQRFSYKEMRDLEISLAGRYQIENAVTALEAVRMLATMQRGRMPSEVRFTADEAELADVRRAEDKKKRVTDFTDVVIRSGVKKTVWPGRFTCIGEHPIFIVDGAHNEDAARQLRRTLETYFPGKQLIYIMGVFKDKDYEKIVEIMAPLAKRVYTVDLPNEERSLDAEKLREVFDAAWRARSLVSEVRNRAEAVGDVKRAVYLAQRDAGEEDVIVAFGSLSYLGQVMEIVTKCVYVGQSDCE